MLADHKLCDRLVLAHVHPKQASNHQNTYYMVFVLSINRDTRKSPELWRVLLQKFGGVGVNVKTEHFVSWFHQFLNFLDFYVYNALDHFGLGPKQS